MLHNAYLWCNIPAFDVMLEDLLLNNNLSPLLWAVSKLVQYHSYIKWIITPLEASMCFHRRNIHGIFFAGLC